MSDYGSSQSVSRDTPKDLDAERSFLGALIQDGTLLSKVSETVGALNEEEFISNKNRLIYKTILQRSASSDDFNRTVLCDMLETDGNLDKAGGYSYIASLITGISLPTSAVIEFAQIIRNKARRRAMIELSEDIINMCYEPNGLSVKEIYDKAAGSIFELVENSNNNTEGPKPVVAQAVELLEKIQKDMRNPNMMSGVPSGFAKLDAITQGLQPGSLNIIAARPSVGKTSFAMNIVANIAMNPDVTKPALVFSLEMPTEQILLRLLSTFGRISMNDLRSGKVNNTHWSDIIRKLKMLTMVLPQDRYMDKLYIDDSSDLTPLELRSRARKLANEYGGLSVIMIDYVQLMRAQSKAANRTLEIAEISRSLKMLAKELKVPVLALAQLNREVDSRKDHRPLNSDLRESGSLEQDADMIMFLQREAIYGPGPGGHDNSNEATLIIGKNRNGAIADIDLHFIGEYTAFYDKGYAEANFDNVAPVPTSDVIAYS